MGQVSALIFSAFAFITVLSFGLQRRRRRIRRARMRRLDWSRMAQGLFPVGSDSSTNREERLGLMLGEALEELDLSYAIVGFHEQGRMKVLHISTRGYAAPLPLRVGMEIDEQQTYAGNFGSRSTSLAIDVASISGWRAHPACQKLGWETYLGAKRSLNGGGYLSVACFATRPRDYLFRANETRFLQDVAAWVENLLVAAGRLPSAQQAEQSVRETSEQDTQGSGVEKIPQA